MTIRSILIANRGEIACRIIHACRRMGVRAVAVYSDADAGALHVAEADAAVRLGPAPASDSYLNIPAVLAAARRAGVEAIHPGYGFLAENAEFAAACTAAGFIFIGPPAEAIAAMGDKRAARALAQRLGVPVIPGYDGPEQTDEAFIREAARIGYPVMVKAAAGGGGKGMRLVHEPAELPGSLAGARRESMAAFGSDALLLEQALMRPRHVEIQVLGDTHGRVVHLGERDCSIQRRHQKIIEESPSPAVTPELRHEMGAAAVKLAEAIGYTGAGTLEFLLDGDAFYFLEMNTRLQVEHPVTELVTGIDLVEWQIRIAGGEALPWRQEDIAHKGHAIEARLYAEDPANDFLPTIGPVLLWRPPAGEGVRVDGGIRDDDEVTMYYDPLLAKLIAHGATRDEAISRLRHALENAILLGMTTNLAWLSGVLRHPAFVDGDVDTRFLEAQAIDARPTADELAVALIAAACARWRANGAGGPGYWRNNPGRPAPWRFRIDGDGVDVSLTPQPRTDNRWTAQLSPDSATREVILHDYARPEMALTVDGYRQRIILAADGDTWWVQAGSGAIRLEALPLLPEPQTTIAAAGSLRAPMPGTVLAVLVAVGQAVDVGQPLMTLEAMKMEHTIRAAAGGVVEAIYFAAGDRVGADELLLQIGEG